MILVSRATGLQIEVQFRHNKTADQFHAVSNHRSWRFLKLKEKIEKRKEKLKHLYKY